MTASRSSVRFARSSCTMPTSVLDTMTKPNSASCAGPTTRITASNVPSRALNGVSVFARTISHAVRLDRAGTSFTSPRATRRATSSADSPTAASGRPVPTGGGFTSTGRA